MHQISNDNFDDLYINLARRMERDGQIISPRKNKTKEICNVMLALTNPFNHKMTIPARKYDIGYLYAEIAWYESCSYSIAGIKDHASIWSQIANDGFANSNYGAIMFRDMDNGFTQWGWCKQKLKEDIDTRQAVINFNQPKHKYENNKDFVCTISMQFIYRNDQLDCIVHMRSNDMIYGLAYDLPWFCINHIKMAAELNLELGTYYHMATSLHVYQKHFKMIEKIAKTKTSIESRGSHD